MRYNNAWINIQHNGIPNSHFQIPNTWKPKWASKQHKQGISIIPSHIKKCNKLESIKLKKKRDMRFPTSKCRKPTKWKKSSKSPQRKMRLLVIWSNLNRNPTNQCPQKSSNKFSQGNKILFSLIGFGEQNKFTLKIWRLSKKVKMVKIKIFYIN